MQSRFFPRSSRRMTPVVDSDSRQKVDSVSKKDTSIGSAFVFGTGALNELDVQLARHPGEVIQDGQFDDVFGELIWPTVKFTKITALVY